MMQAVFFCKEPESINHLFFDCVVARQLWKFMSEALDKEVGLDFVSLGNMWLTNMMFIVENMFCSAALWGLWKLRNCLCF